MSTLIQNPTRILFFTGKGGVGKTSSACATAIGLADGADIKPFAWIVNQSLTPLDVTDPVLRSRRAQEATHLRELADHSAHIVLEPWSVGFVGSEHIR